MSEFKRRGVLYEVLRAENELNILRQKYRDDGQTVSSDYFVVGILMPDIEDWVVAWRFDSFVRATNFFDDLKNI